MSLRVHFDKKKCFIFDHNNFGPNGDKEGSNVLSFERDKGCVCIPIGCNSVRIFVLADRNTEITVVPLK